jgi:hypothetical protein
MNKVVQSAQYTGDHFMKSKLVVLTTILFILFCFILFCLETQAKPGEAPYQRLKANTARAVSFQSTSTDIGHVVVTKGNEHSVQPKNFFDLANQSVRFAPHNLGGYDVSVLEEVKFTKAFGEVLDLTDDDSRKVAIGFSFPFFGQQYTDLFVNSDGNLTFGKGDASSREARDLQRFLEESPRIGVLYTDLNPFDSFGFGFGEGDTTVEVKKSPEQITITWFNVPAFDSFGGNVITMQAVLSNTGVIDLRFEETEVRTGIVGIAPGGINDASQVTLLDFSADLPLEGVTGAIAEVFVDMPTVNLQNVAREFYRTHGDDFDSLILFTNFESDLDAFGLLGFAVPVKGDVLGIGNPYPGGISPLFDNTDDYGSQGKLRTLLVMKNLKVWADDPLENFGGPATSTLSVVAHEFGHGWGVDINPPILLGRGFTHWNFFLHTNGSFMGGNDIQDNEDGTFTTQDPKDSFGPLDLYLMGLLKPEEVPPTFLVTEPYDIDIPPPFDDPSRFGNLRFSNPMGDVTFRGETEEITIEDIIAANGERIPDAESSQKDFRVAFILLAMGEEDPTPDEIEKVAAVRRLWAPYFHRSVNNLATMVSTLDGSIEDVRLPEEEGERPELTFTLTLNRGLNIISPPLRSSEPFTARTLMEFVNATMIIGISETGKFTPWTIETPGDGFPIEGGRGYIVNTPDGGAVTFTGDPWSDELAIEVGESASAPSVNASLWAFVVDGALEGDGHQGPYQTVVQNLRTNDRIANGLTASGGRFTLAVADLNRAPVVQIGDVLRMTIIDTTSGLPIGKTDRIITPDDMWKAYSTIHLTFADLAPMRTRLLQNYPNPFNPETWIPYELSLDADVSITIYNPSGQIIRTLRLGNQPAGSYLPKDKAVYWDGRNESGELVGSSLYFYQLRAGDFTEVKRMVILK